MKAVGRGFGPSERLTWNFANFDESTLNMVTGESGIFLSPYYMDQWAAWYGGSTFAFPFSQAAVEKHRAHEMTLGRGRESLVAGRWSSAVRQNRDRHGRRPTAE